MKRFWLVLLYFAAAPLLWGAEDVTALFTYKYDVDSNAVAYCRLVGQQNSPFGGSISGAGRIKTAGSSVTITSVTALTNAFAGVDIGDLISVQTSPGSTVLRTVVTNADDDTVTVDTAVDLGTTGVAYRYWMSECGTGATSGWIDLSQYPSRSITIQYDQGDLTQLDIRVECKANYPGAEPVQVFPVCTVGACNTYQAYTTAGITSRTATQISAPFGSCRVGFKWTTADTSDAGANVEWLTIGVQAQKE